jgi:hypothetical protein
LIVALAMLLPFSPFASLLGFIAPPASLFVVLGATRFFYLLLAQLVKRAFYRLFTSGLRLSKPRLLIHHKRRRISSFREVNGG